MGSETVPVFNHKRAFGGGGNLFGGRQHGIRKNIFTEPGISGSDGRISRNGMQQKQAFRCQAVMDQLYISPVIFNADMFKHAYGDNTVKFFSQVAIIQ